MNVQLGMLKEADPETVAASHESRHHRRARHSIGFDVSAQHGDMVTFAERAGHADEAPVAPTQLQRLRAGR